MKDLRKGIRVLFFSSIAEELGLNNIIIENIPTTKELLEFLYSKYPGLKNKKFRIAVNKQLISGNKKLNGGDEVALLPPFSGG